MILKVVGAILGSDENGRKRFNCINNHEETPIG